ncbi:hypothetical protein H4R33_003257 [Dimargaris cristalligena]|nr:hypothetical protein H4R33_003257 [Dimargaris cristalligena]
MDITRLNFESQLGYIQQTITDASFIAIDAEFSGDSLDHVPRDDPDDTPEVRYHKCRRLAETFDIVRFGLTAFVWRPAHHSAGRGGSSKGEKGLEASIALPPSPPPLVPSNQKRFGSVSRNASSPIKGNGGDHHVSDVEDYYEAHSFNFYLFPTTQSVGRAHLDVVGNFQNSAMDRLAKARFDFNTWVNHGIPYMNSPQAKECRRLRHLEIREPRPDIPVDEKNRAFYQDICAQLTKWMGTDTPFLRIPVANNYQRRLVHQTVRGFGPRYFSQSFPNCIQIGRETTAQAQKRKKRLIQEFEANLKKARGFSRVIRMLRKAAKPIIGHDLFPTLVHLYDQFCTHLPPTLTAFKKALHRQFPHMWDTRNIAEALTDGRAAADFDCTLEGLYTAAAVDADTDCTGLRRDATAYPVIHRVHHGPPPADCDRLGPAGVNSLAAGIVFARLHGALHERNRVSAPPGDKALPIAFGEDVLRPFASQLHMGQMKVNRLCVNDPIGKFF